MSPLASVAPMKAFLGSTPISIIGGAIISVRASVYPASFQPDPLSCSRTRAAV